MTRRTQMLIWAAALGGALCVAWALHSLTAIGWLPAWLVAVNLGTFAAYGLDKAAARSRRWRLPELLLHALSLLGGSIGAIAGQQVFRHKTAKRAFLAVFWLIFLAQAALVVWLLTRS